MCRKDTDIDFRNILKELFESAGGLLSYTLYSRLGIEPETILRFIEEYTKSGIIKVSDDGSRITLSPGGRGACAAEMRRLEQKMQSDGGEYLGKLLTQPMPKYAPYLPNTLPF